MWPILAVIPIQPNAACHKTGKTYQTIANKHIFPMPPKGTKRDVNLDCPAVIEFKNIIHLQLNYLQRQFVVENVSCCERGLAIWRCTLTEFMLEGKNPRNVVYMVKVWANQFFCGDPCIRFTRWHSNGNGKDGN